MTVHQFGDNHYPSVGALFTQTTLDEQLLRELSDLGLGGLTLKYILRDITAEQARRILAIVHETPQPEPSCTWEEFVQEYRENTTLSPRPA